MNSREIIRALNATVKSKVRGMGDHHHFRHPGKPGLVTAPARRDLPVGILRSIERQTGLKPG
jgi:predicted RNA binding protein YcfA (HicA-like mRNA interferase family)